MSIIRWTPIINPLDDFDHMFDQMPSFSAANFVPALDVYQTDTDVVVETPLAGIKPENVNISLENDILTIEGKSEKKSEVDEKNYFRREVRRGAFHRSVAMPVAVDGNKAKAEYHDGLLKIVIPKDEDTKAKCINIDIKK
jgi:HSP20 family protein